MDKIVLIQGDDYPRLLFQLYDKENTTIPVDISNLTVLIKFREKGTTDVLMMTTGNKDPLLPHLGLVYLDWPATALDQDDGNYELEISTAASSSTGTITDATQDSPVVITSAGHDLTTGDEIYIASVGGMTEINNLPFIVTVIDSDTFSLDGVDGSDYTAYTSGGTWAKYSGIQTGLDLLSIRIKEDF